MSLLIPNAHWSEAHAIIVGVGIPCLFAVFVVAAFCRLSKQDQEAVEQWEAMRAEAEEAEALAAARRLPTVKQVAETLVEAESFTREASFR